MHYWARYLAGEEIMAVTVPITVAGLVVKVIKVTEITLVGFMVNMQIRAVSQV
ncbi:Uncharacterised protein [Serratia fonticola]|uniref:Uncharacterized protein n=1 Tax=Serratia fonticola TaxID=47917 RepID=A0A3S4XMS2_SERFO|nr:Uncharacterised protein [Serratia fonticola]CAI1671522.1 Uncharacterised protein [Serratia fonticola]VEI70599.1 Uncharacterised protein [Serratia fonticola]